MHEVDGPNPETTFSSVSKCHRLDYQCYNLVAECLSTVAGCLLAIANSNLTLDTVISQGTHSFPAPDGRPHELRITIPVTLTICPIKF